MRDTALKASMARNGLTVADLSLLTGSSTRMVEYWRSGRWPPPQWLTIILAAMDDGLITIDWLVAKLKDSPKSS